MCIKTHPSRDTFISSSVAQEGLLLWCSRHKKWWSSRFKLWDVSVMIMLLCGGCCFWIEMFKIKKFNKSPSCKLISVQWRSVLLWVSSPLIKIKCHRVVLPVVCLKIILFELVCHTTVVRCEHVILGSSSHTLLINNGWSIEGTRAPHLHYFWNTKNIKIK